MKYLSVCSGIEAATCAWHPLGWEPVAFSEIERFPSAVLAHHYPNIPNYGDITKFKDWPDRSIDLLVGGTPCQSFSGAGLRKGLADPRGNLALTFLAIVDRYRPRWVVWENVPGVHSSWSDAASGAPGEGYAAVAGALGELRNAAFDLGLEIGEDFTAAFGPGAFEECDQTNDFDCFLAGLEELGYGVATRVLDAQYVRVESHHRSVPQRRRRVFVVGYLGDWRRAAAVLFERESLCGYPAPCRHAGQGPAPTLSSRASGGGGLGTDFDCDGGLIAKPLLAGGHANNPLDETLIHCGEIVPQAMSSKWSKGTSGPAGDECANLVAYSSPAVGIPEVGTFQETGHGWWNDDTVAQSLRDASLGGGSHSNIVAHALRGEGFDASEDGTGRGTPLVATIHLNGTDVQEGGDRANTVSAGNSKMPDTLVAFSCKDHGADASEIAPTLRSMGHDGSHANGGGQVAIAFRAAGQDGFTAATVSPPVAATDGGGAGIPTVAFNIHSQNSCAMKGAGSAEAALETSVSRCMDAAGFTENQGGTVIAGPSFAVRRLTPRECERLQGFPDDYTDIPGAKDGPRYKALGNSMACNVMRWIGDRIQQVEEIYENPD